MLVGICLFCGLPGAGKTTFVQYLKENSPPDYKLVHVCYDKLMPHVDHSKDVNAWKLARTSILQHVERMLLYITGQVPDVGHIVLGNDCELVDSELEVIYTEIKTSLKMSQIVFVIDDNMQYRGMRKEYYRICSAHSVGLSIVYFDISLEKCLENNEKRINGVQASTIKKLHQQIEVPGSNPKNKWEKYVIFLKLNEVNEPKMLYTDIFNLISESIKYPPTSLSTENCAQSEESRTISRKNFIHQADICMRRYISNHLKSLKNEPSGEKNVNEIFQKLNLAKKSVTMLLKLGFVDESEYFDDNEMVNLELLENKISNLMESELI